MAKRSGLGSAFYVGSRDVSGDVGAINSAATSRALQDVSSIQSSGTERIVLRSDGEISYTAFWNPAAARSVATFSDLANAHELVSWADGTALGSYCASLWAHKVTFQTVSGQDGSLGITGQALGSLGTKLEWGQLLTIGKQTFAATAAIASWTANTPYSLNDLVVPTTANGHYYKTTTAGTSHITDEPTWPTNGTTVADGTAVWTDQGLLPNGLDDLFPRTGTTSTAFGLAAYVHLISIGSGSITFTVQDSANRIAWANVTGGGFTAMTAAGAQRIQTATNGTVRRYVRVHPTGTFTNAVAVVNYVRYLNQQP
jgi:hypothetical protein